MLVHVGLQLHDQAVCCLLFYFLLFVMFLYLLYVAFLFVVVYVYVSIFLYLYSPLALHAVRVCCWDILILVRGGLLPE